MFMTEILNSTAKIENHEFIQMKVNSKWSVKITMKQGYTRTDQDDVVPL